MTGKFDAENPAIQANLAPGAVPATTFGLITEAMARRRERGIGPSRSSSRLITKQDITH